MMYNCLIHGLSNGSNCPKCGNERNIAAQKAYSEYLSNGLPMNKEKKMTREEAYNKCKNISDAVTFISILEALGLIKFEKKKESVNLVELRSGNITHDCDYKGQYGVIRLEEWPEGLVLWVGGKIVYKSWEKK